MDSIRIINALSNIVLDDMLAGEKRCIINQHIVMQLCNYAVVMLVVMELKWRA